MNQSSIASTVTIASNTYSKVNCAVVQKTKWHQVLQYSAATQYYSIHSLQELVSEIHFNIPYNK